MIEDKLDKDQRIRLECLAQANTTSHGQSAEHVIEKASRFEKFIVSGTADEATN